MLDLQYFHVNLQVSQSFLFYAFNMLGSKSIFLRYIPNIHNPNAAEESEIYSKTLTFA